LPKIKALLKHSDAKTVVAIAAVLKKFNDPEGYEIYYEIVTGERKGGGGILDGVKDKKSLEKMGVEEAVGFILFGGIGIGAYDYFKQNDSSNVNAAAVTALAQDRDPASERALVRASFGGKEIVQIAALRALAKRGDPAVEKDIEPAMYSEKSLISYTAAATVVHLTSQRLKLQS
jgi:HEAT repeat protein